MKRAPHAHCAPPAGAPSPRVGRRRRAAWLALLMLSMGMALPAAAGNWADWRHPEARFRLRAGRAEPTGKAHLLRVDIPVELQSATKGIVAYFGDHQPTPSAAVLSGGVVVAAEVQVPASQPFDPAFASVAAGQFPDPYPVLVYLLEQAAAPNPLPESERKPLAVYWVPERYIARPNSAAEYRALEARLGAMPFREDLPGFVVPGGGRPAYLEFLRQSAVRLRFSTTLTFPEAQRLRLGADGPSTVWFLYVDGHLTVDWKNHNREESGAFLSEPLDDSRGGEVQHTVERGFHRRILPQGLAELAAEGQGRAQDHPRPSA